MPTPGVHAPGLWLALADLVRRARGAPVPAHGARDGVESQLHPAAEAVALARGLCEKQLSQSQAAAL